MRGRPVRSSLSHVVALVTVALLTLAGVRSTVMQAGEALAATPLCVTPATGAASDHAHGKAHPAPCEFCAAAAHAPVCADAPGLPAPTAVAWLTPAPVSALGPRGPPAFRARARAPPELPTA